MFPGFESLTGGGGLSAPSSASSYANNATGGVQIGAGLMNDAPAMTAVTLAAGVLLGAGLIFLVKN